MNSCHLTDDFKEIFQNISSNHLWKKNQNKSKLYLGIIVAMKTLLFAYITNIFIFFPVLFLYWGFLCTGDTSFDELLENVYKAGMGKDELCERFSVYQ